MKLTWKGGDIGSRCQDAPGMCLPVLWTFVSSIDITTGPLGYRFRYSSMMGSNNCSGFQGLREKNLYSAFQSCWERPNIQMLWEMVRSPMAAGQASACSIARRCVRRSAKTSLQPSFNIET